MKTLDNINQRDLGAIRSQPLIQSSFSGQRLSTANLYTHATRV